MTEDELATILLKKNPNLGLDPTICRIAARHLIAFVTDLTDAQREKVMGVLDSLIVQIESLESMAKHPAPRKSLPQADPKPKAFDKFVNFITLDWLV